MRFVKLTILKILPEQGDLRCVAGQFIGGLQNHGKTAQLRVVHDGPESIQPKRTVPQTFVPVFMAFERIFGVIQIQGIKPVKADHPVKFRQNAAKIKYHAAHGGPVLFRRGWPPVG